MKKIKQSEDNFQVACTSWLRLQYPNILFHHSPNGGKRNAREAAKFKRMGTKSGCPDLMIYYQSLDYVGLAIELKVGKNTATDNQLAFMAKLTANGWLCMVIYRIDEFIKLVTGYISATKYL